MNAKKVLAVFLSFLLLISSVSVGIIPVSATESANEATVLPTVHFSTQWDTSVSLTYGTTISNLVEGETYTISALWKSIAGNLWLAAYGSALSDYTSADKKYVLVDSSKTPAADVSYSAATGRVAYTFTATGSELTVFTDMKSGSPKAHEAYLADLVIYANDGTKVFATTGTYADGAITGLTNFGSSWGDSAKTFISFTETDYAFFGSTEPATCTHTYDHGCDNICDNCGNFRVIPGHTYDNGCDATCNSCGSERANLQHQYDDDKDTTCNNCGDVRLIFEPGTVFGVLAEGWTNEATQGFGFTVSNLTAGTAYTLSFLWKAVGGAPYVGISGNAVGSGEIVLADADSVKNGAVIDYETGHVRYTFTAQGTTATVTSYINSAETGYGKYYFADGTICPTNNPDEPVFVTDWITLDGWGDRWGNWQGGKKSNFDPLLFEIEYSLSLDSLSVNSEAFADFHPANFNYALTVPYKVDSALITPTLGDDGESYVIKNANGDEISVADLKVGDNVYTIVVTNFDQSVVTYTVTITRQEHVHQNGELEKLLVEFSNGTILDYNALNDTLSVLQGTTLADIFAVLPTLEGYSFVCYDEDGSLISEKYYDVAVVRDGFGIDIFKDNVPISAWSLLAEMSLSHHETSPVTVIDPTVLHANEATHTLTVKQGVTIAEAIAALSLGSNVTLDFYDEDGTYIGNTYYETAVIRDGFALDIMQNQALCGAWTFATKDATDMTDIGVWDLDADNRVVHVLAGTTLEDLAPFIPMIGEVDVRFFDEDGSFISSAYYEVATIRDGFTVRVLKNGVTLTEWTFAVAEEAPCTTHVYDADCDADCNVCGTTRDVSHTTASGACSHCCSIVTTYVITAVLYLGDDLSITYTITIVDAEKDDSAHTYDGNCDATCNNCGAVREATTHTYTDITDTTCNNCGLERDITAPIVGIDNVSTNVGETFTVPVRVVNNPGIISIMTLVEYDADALELVSYEANGDFPATAISYGPDGQNPFTITYADGLATENNTTNGVIANLTFKVKDGATPGDYTLAVSYRDTYNFDWDEPAFETQNGTVSVAPSKYAPLLKVDDATVEVGATFTVPVRVVNNPGIISVMTTVGYDANVLELVSYAADGDFPSGAISWGPDGQNPFTITYADGLAMGNNTTDGVIANLTFKVKDDAPAGDYTLTLAYRDSYNFDWDEPVFITQNGTITVSAPVAPSHIPGDVTDDGKVNNKDLMFLQRYLNNWDIEINLAAADVTGDDKINNKDWMFLQRYLNHWDIELV